MYRIVLAALAVSAFALAPASAAINVDGDISDWNTSLLHTDVNHYNGAAGLEQWGATVQNGRVYCIMKTAAPDGLSSKDRSYGGLWIDADQSTTTQLDGLYSIQQGWWHGTDIYVEYGQGVKSGGVIVPDGFGYWGVGHANGSVAADFATPVTTGAPVQTDDTLEFSFSLSELKSKLYEYNHGFVNGCETLGAINGKFNVGVRLAVHNNNVGWDVDGDGELGGVLVEETLVMLEIAAQAGDANWDGVTNATDLNTVLSFYNQTGTTWATGNFNGGNTTDATDLNTVLSFYNQTLGGTGGSLQMGTVPEPASIVMLATLSALVGAWVIRRRSR